MKNSIPSQLNISIVGGGQLGRMLSLAASNWSIKTNVLDPSSSCPAATVCTHFVQGDFNDYDTVYKFGDSADIITIEIENVNADALIQLEKEGKTVIPDPNVLKIIQDKGLQKQHYQHHQIPTSPFQLFSTEEEIIDAENQGALAIPFVQKSRKAGYDGKGVSVIKTQKQLHEHLLKGPSVVENMIAIKKEIAVIVVKNKKGDVKCFPPVEMVFNETSNLVETLICPAQLNDKLVNAAENLAVKTINSFKLLGILAVEMFLDENNKLMVNEVAPRPHNSGHHTIEATITSQYEQLLRALFNFSLGSTDIKIPAVMINLLGDPNYSGVTNYQGISEVLKIDGVKLHLYGKQTTRPNRKMGHITILDKDINNALKKAKIVKNNLKIISQ